MDYNIYIHNLTGKGGKASQTKAWENGSSSETTSWNDNEESTEALSVIRNISSVASNPDSLVSAGVGAITKAVPWVAGAMIVARMIESVVTNVADYVSTETGDYRFSVEYSNFKGIMRTVTQPFSTAYEYFKMQQQIRLSNNRAEQYRQLLGDISINNMASYGV